MQITDDLRLQVRGMIIDIYDYLNDPKTDKKRASLLREFKLTTELLDEYLRNVLEYAIENENKSVKSLTENFLKTSRPRKKSKLDKYKNDDRLLSLEMVPYDVQNKVQADNNNNNNNLFTSSDMGIEVVEIETILEEDETANKEEQKNKDVMVIEAAESIKDNIFKKVGVKMFNKIGKRTKVMLIILLIIIVAGGFRIYNKPTTQEQEKINEFVNNMTIKSKNQDVKKDKKIAIPDLSKLDKYTPPKVVKTAKLGTPVKKQSNEISTSNAIIIKHKPKAEVKKPEPMQMIKKEVVKQAKVAPLKIPSQKELNNMKVTDTKNLTPVKNDVKELDDKKITVPELIKQTTNSVDFTKVIPKKQPIKKVEEIIVPPVAQVNTQIGDKGAFISKGSLINDINDISRYTKKSFMYNKKEYFVNDTFFGYEIIKIRKNYIKFKDGNGFSFRKAIR
jgi:hypothetical protein